MTKLQELGYYQSLINDLCNSSMAEEVCFETFVDNYQSIHKTMNRPEITRIITYVYFDILVCTKMSKLSLQIRQRLNLSTLELPHTNSFPKELYAFYCLSSALIWSVIIILYWLIVISFSQSKYNLVHEPLCYLYAGT